MLAPYVEAHERGPLLDLASAASRSTTTGSRAVREESGIDLEYRRIGTLETGAANRSIIAEHGYVGRRARRSPSPAPPSGAARSSSAIASSGSSAREDARCAITATDNAFEPRSMSCSRPARGRTRSKAFARRRSGPVRGQLLHLGWTRRPALDDRLGPALLCRPAAGRHGAGGRDCRGGRIRRTADGGGVRGLLDAVCDLLPAARTATFLEARVGLRPATPDELPVIGARSRSARPLPRVRALSQWRAAGADHRQVDRGPGDRASRRIPRLESISAPRGSLGDLRPEGRSYLTIRISKPDLLEFGSLGSSGLQAGDLGRCQSAAARPPVSAVIDVPAPQLVFTPPVASRSAGRRSRWRR